MNDGDGIYLFSEQDNGSKKSNYASEPVEVNMTEPTARAIVSSFTGIEGENSQTIRDLADNSDYTTTLSAQAGYSLPKKIIVSKARLLDMSKRRDSWRSHVHRTRLRSACSYSSLRLPMCGVKGHGPLRSLLGVQGGHSLT